MFQSSKKKNEFPIKYIENNLIFNHEDECFAYYELIPYNYSFLSQDEKLAVGESFRQLVAQTQGEDGKIHSLQIAMESSIPMAQENAKKLIRESPLKQAAIQRIDGQTEAFIQYVGETQIDYRFFMGFKLIQTEEEFSFDKYYEKFKSAFDEFFKSVNHHMMGDFVSMPDAKIERYYELESLMSSKVSGRFAIRPVVEQDIGYIIEHLYGLQGIAYEEYQYSLTRYEGEKQTLIKKYDLLKLARSLINEKQRYLEIDNEYGTTYAAYFTIDTIVGELEFPGSELFYHQQRHFNFPVDTSMNIEIVSNKKALTTVRNKKKELKDLDEHAWESDNDTSNTVIEALDDVTELENDLEQTRECMYKLSYVVRVTAKSPEKLKERCAMVRDFYDDYNIKLVRPFGDMLGLHYEFIPTNGRYLNDYVQYVTSDFIAGLGFGAAQMLGDSSGFYIGFNVDTGRNVYLNPSLAAQGVKESVTNALAMAFLGSLGGGKSFLNNLIVIYVVLFGGKAIILDPKAERGGWAEALPDMAEEINVINLTSDEKNRGMLDPYNLMQNLKDSESLAVDILTFLTGISSRDGEKFPVLRKAVRTVTQSQNRGMLNVIAELKNMDTAISINIAEHIESFTDYDFAQLLFGDGEEQGKIDFSKQLNIIQVADLTLPEASVAVTEYTNMEMISVAMLLVLSTFSLDFIHSDRSLFKVVDLDEAWAFLQVAQGKVLSMKLTRAGRAMNAGVYFVTQNTGDLDDEKMKNNIGVKFAFRSTDITEIRNTLEFLGVDPEDENNQNRLRNLKNGQCLMCDLYGRVGVLQVDCVFADLFDAIDTRPPQEAQDEVAV